MLANEEPDSTAVEHGSDLVSINLALNPEVIGFWHDLTNTAGSNGIVYSM